MAAGNLTLFNAFAVNCANGLIDLDTHTFKAILLTSSFSPSNSHALYADVSAYEVAGANGYTSGGATLSSVTWVRSGAICTFDSADVSWTATGSITARYIAILDDTAAGKPLVGYALLDNTPANVTIPAGNTLTLGPSGADGWFQIEANPDLFTAFEWPNASNSGVPTGTTLTSYTGSSTISANGTVIDSKIINTSGLVVTGSNVIIRKCQINFTGWWGIDAETAANITIEDCTITGPGTGGTANACILAYGTIQRNNISNSGNGIVLASGSGGAVVKGNYVHTLRSADADEHYDGIAVQGVQDDVLIEDNHVEGRDTSCVFIKTDFGTVNNIRVNHNRLINDPVIGGPSYEIYSVEGWGGVGVPTNISITNNVIQYGLYGYRSLEGTVTWSGNVDYITGAPIS